MKKLILLLLSIQLGLTVQAQDSKKLLDEVSTKMGAYTNMQIDFSSSLTNEEAGIKEGDEPPIRGKITLQGEKYSLHYLGNNLMFDGKKLYAINPEEKEVNITEGDLEEESGFIYPSKLLTFYKEGYTLQWGKLKNEKGRKIQYINLTPMDSSSELSQVLLGIDAKTKHIYKLIQVGTNGSKTIITITNLKSNQTLPKNFFSFDKKKYLKNNYSID